jgi:hypothetical protein
MFDEVKRYDGYEIQRVLEYKHLDGTTFCEPWAGTEEELEAARLQDDYVGEMWSLYGHTDDGVEAFADFYGPEGEEAALKVLYAITGIKGEKTGGYSGYELPVNETETITRRMGELVYDLSYNAGHNNLMAQLDCSSRDLLDDIWAWAVEFEAMWNAAPEVEQEDYIGKIDEFYREKEAGLLEWES